MKKIALISGITGQDGAYLAEFLLQKGYEVHGLRQPTAVPDTIRIDHLLGSLKNLHLHCADMTDAVSLVGLINQVLPDEVYNLAAQTHVHLSYAVPDQTLQVNGSGILSLLEAIRLLGLAEKTRIFQASTSEMFGSTPPPQAETSCMNPLSPYAASKLYAYHMVKIYRHAYGLHASNGIMFNHESPLRGEHFVTRKIAIAAARIAKGSQDTLYLGNLDARRDWSHARDMVKGMWMMLQQEEPEDYVLASGRAASVRDFAIEAFRVAGIPLTWKGEGLYEQGIDARSGKTIIAIDPELFRPLEVENLLGDPSKAHRELGWQAAIPLAAIVREMVEAELKREVASEENDRWEAVCA